MNLPLFIATALSLALPCSAHAGARELVADNGEPGDYFGWSVAAEGTRAVIGAIGADRNGLERTGAAYVFDVATGEQLFELTSNELTPRGNFGVSVALSGDRAVVGASFDDTVAERSGAAYVFDLNSGQQLFKLIPDDLEEESWFGHAVAINGDYAWVSSQKRVQCPFPHGGSRCSMARTYLYDLATGELARTIDVLGSIRPQIALDGSNGVIGGEFAVDDDDAVSVIEIVTGGLLTELPIAPPLSPTDIGFLVRADSGAVVVADLWGDPIYIFDTATGQQFATLTPPEGGDFEFLYESSVALKGALVAVRGHVADEQGGRLPAVFFYDARTGARARTIPYDSPALGPAFLFGNAIAIADASVLIGSFAAGEPGDGRFGPGAVTVVDLHPADLDFDGAVGASDLATLLAAWGAAGPEDLDDNGVVDAGDLAVLFSAWNAAP